MKNLLKQYSSLIKERNETRTRIERINRQLAKLNAEGNVKDSVKGGLGNLQTFHIEGFPVAKEDRLKYQLSRQKQILEMREADIADLTNELELWLNGIDDSRMRRLITKRLIEDKTWAEVACEMGDKYTEDSCKKQYERYLRELDDEE